MSRLKRIEAKLNKILAPFLTNGRKSRVYVEHPGSFTVIEYEAENFPGDVVKVFIGDDVKVPLVMELHGLRYRQKTLIFGRPDPTRDRGSDEWLYRKLTGSERHLIAGTEADELWVDKSIRKRFRTKALLKRGLIAQYQDRMVCVPPERS